MRRIVKRRDLSLKGLHKEGAAIVRVPHWSVKPVSDHVTVGDGLIQKKNRVGPHGVNPILDVYAKLSIRQLRLLRSRSGFFLRRRRNFLYRRRGGGRSGATTAALRSRAARGLGRTAGRGWLAAAHCLNLARGRSGGRGARGRSGFSTAGRLRRLAALDLRGLAAVLGFSGSAESSQNGQGRAQRNQLHRTTHDVSLSLHYDGSASWPSIEVNGRSPHGSAVQND